MVEWVERGPKDLWSQNKLLQAKLFPFSTSMISNFSEKLPTTPRAETWTTLVSLGSLSTMFGKGFWDPEHLGFPLMHLHHIWPHYKQVEADTQKNWWDMPSFSPFLIPDCPSWWGAVEVSLTHHFLPSCLPPAGLSIMIRGFLQRNCCQSPFHHPNNSSDNVWLITYPLILLLSGVTISKSTLTALSLSSMVRQPNRAIFSKCSFGIFFKRATQSLLAVQTCCLSWLCSLILLLWMTKQELDLNSF